MNKEDNTINSQVNATIDIVKLIMAILVIGIHTNPFSFNIWLDRGFGILTRLCVPFFFVASSYFYWKKKSHKPGEYVLRLLVLYILWTLIYLPQDLKAIGHYSILELIDTFLWSGYRHLWFLNGSIIGFTIVYLLSKFLSTKNILLISLAFLIIGCAKSTWQPLFINFTGNEVSDMLGYRNGLFYAFPYFALGKSIAEQKTVQSTYKTLLGFLMSLLLLIIESYIFILHFNTKATILWLSVFPMTYFLFNSILVLHVRIGKTLSIEIRKLSTLLYCIHPLVILVLSSTCESYVLYFSVTFMSIIISCLIIRLSKIQKLKLLRYLY